MAEKDTLENEKTLKQLEISYEMYEKTKKQTERTMKSKLKPDNTKQYTQKEIDEQLSIISNAQDDVVAQYVLLGGDKNNLGKKKTSKKETTLQTPSFDMETIRIINEQNENRKESINDKIAEASSQVMQQFLPSRNEYNPSETFDVIPLPSKGEGYKDKISRMSVSYLNAYDENMIASPNLYRDNLILDYLLQEKVLSKEIDPMDLLEGDREAIILFLRANGYGPEYPIKVTDDNSGINFDAVVDLSKLKYKDFNLVGDSNGWFSYTLPISKKEVKFRFPTHRDNIILEKLAINEDNKARKDKILRCVESLDEIIESDNNINAMEKSKIRQSIRTIEGWGDNIDEEGGLKFNHTITNKLNLLIMAVDGITDRQYISNFISHMNVRDSMKLRKYMTDNEPGIDYNIDVERPESLGGGSVATFLQLDQFLFLNISD